jgi:hypothetical protein
MGRAVASGVTPTFLKPAGPALHTDNLSRLTRDYLEAAGIAKRGACHLLRHTMATGMLEHGARRAGDPGDPRPCAADNHAALHAGVDPAAQSGAHGDAPRGDPGTPDHTGGGRRHHRPARGVSRFFLSR